jgi:hypothetical protein
VAQAAGLAGEEGLAQAILRTVNHGLVRHVPVVGSLSDEAEALGEVLRSSTSERVELARELGWEPLGKLATFQAILDDGPLLEDVDRGAGGDLLALYRLQSNERNHRLLERGGRAASDPRASSHAPRGDAEEYPGRGRAFCSQGLNRAEKLRSAQRAEREL